MKAKLSPGGPSGGERAEAARPRLLLVNPWITDFAAYDLWARPAGLLLLAGLLRHSGYAVDLVDCLQRSGPGPGHLAGKAGRYGTGKFDKTPLPTPVALATLPRQYFRYGLPEERLARRLAERPRPDLIWVSSAMTYWYPGVQQTIAVLRRIWPGVPIWLGGTYARLCPDHARGHAGADRVITEDLASLPALLAEATGHPPAHPASWRALSEAPPLAHDLVPNATYAPLLSSLGCPLRCPYCASAKLHPAFQRRPAPALLDEIGWCEEALGIRDFAFHDDALLLDAGDTLLAALEQLATWDRKLRFHTPNGVHVNSLAPAVCRLLKESGFVTLRLGLETVQDSDPAAAGRKTDWSRFEEAVGNLMRVGFGPQEIGVYLLAGLPDQRPADVAGSIEAVAGLGVKPFLAEYAPIPGSALWDRARAQSAFDLDEPLVHNNTFFACRREDFRLEDLLALKAQAARVRKSLRGPG